MKHTQSNAQGKQTVWARYALAVGLLAGSGIATAATITVNATTDGVVVNGNCTLREALQAARNDQPVDQCTAGSGADVVLLPDGSYTLTGGQLVIDSGSLTLQPLVAGTRPQIRNTGPTLARVLALRTGAIVTLESLEIAFGDGRSDLFIQGGGIYSDGATLTARDVLFRFNQARLGGGLSFRGIGTNRLQLEGCSFRDNNTVTTTDQPNGSALSIDLRDDASAGITGGSFRSNQAVSSAGAIFGSVVTANIRDRAVLEVATSSFTGNGADAGPGQPVQGAFWVFGSGSARLAISDSAFRDNQQADAVALSVTALGMQMNDTTNTDLRRLRFERNDFDNGQADHVRLVLRQLATLRGTNMLIADGPVAGLRATVDAGSLLLGNLTIVNHSGFGLLSGISSTGTLRHEHVLIWTTQGYVAPPDSFDSLAFLNTTNPQFVDPDAGDYRLGPNSPAADAGNRSLPSVDRFDVNHAARIIGSQPDFGAFERGGVYADGFE